LAVSEAERVGMVKASGLAVPLASPLHVRNVDGAVTITERDTASPATNEPVAHAKLLVGFCETLLVPGLSRLSVSA